MILATGISKPQIPLGNSTVVLIADKEKINYKYDVKLTTLKGEEVNLSDLKGMVVFLNLWASWCSPCIAEMPNIQKLYDKVDKSKVAFVMLSLDKDEDKARKFIEKKKHSFPVYFLSEGLPEDLSTNSIPTTFVLDRNGNILTRHEGMADYDTDEFRNYLMSLTKK